MDTVPVVKAAARDHWVALGGTPGGMDLGHPQDFLVETKVSWCFFYRFTVEPPITR